MSRATALGERQCSPLIDSPFWKSCIPADLEAGVFTSTPRSKWPLNQERSAAYILTGSGKDDALRREYPPSSHGEATLLTANAFYSHVLLRSKHSKSHRRDSYSGLLLEKDCSCIPVRYTSQ